MNYMIILAILFAVIVIAVTGFFIGCSWNARLLGKHKYAIQKYLSLTQDSKYIVDNTMDRRLVWDEEKKHKQRGKDLYGS